MNWLRKLYFKYKCFRQQHTFLKYRTETSNDLVISIHVKCIHCDYNKFVYYQYFYD